MLSHILECGDKTGIPLVFIHGNFSSSCYFEELMLSIPDSYYCIAVDLRGYGFSEDLLIDATRGASDWADDLHALFETLGISSAHLIGWSAGAAAIMQFMLDHVSNVKSLTLISPVSPFGFGGSKGADGQACYEDYSGSGGGVVPEAFIDLIRQQDRTADSPVSPRNVINTTLVKPPCELTREEDFLTASLMQKVGGQRYPGDAEVSSNWPYTSPGKWGPINAISAKYLNLSGITGLPHKPPILWVRGDSDMIISDHSLSDSAVLGELGLIPEWPGKDIYPAQPMVLQMSTVLNDYKNNGGAFKEVVMADVGHSPFLEQPEEFLEDLLSFLSNN
jgi:pimeloyl-ACP methyl ester carboxylesterase